MKRRIRIKFLFWMAFLNLIIVTGCHENINVPTYYVERIVFQMINEHRTGNGLNELAIDSVISEMCREHSQNMASGTSPFGHKDFETRVSRLREIISFNMVGENVGFVSGADEPARAIVDIWLSSQEHLENVLGNYNMTGVGAAKSEDGDYYVTQIYLRTN